MHVRPIDPKTATVPVVFILEDPEGLTGKPQGEVALKAAKGQNLLEVALSHGINVEHACGGVCACSTCHVIVKEGFDSIPGASEDEEDQLDNARGLKPTSRLACQAVPNGAKDVVVEIPSWNRNLVAEDHH